MTDSKPEATAPTKLFRFVNQLADIGLVAMTAIFATLLLFQREGRFQTPSLMWVLLMAACSVLLWGKYWLRIHDARLFRWYYLSVAFFFTAITIAIAISVMIRSAA